MKPKVLIATPISKEVEDYIAKFCDYVKWEGEFPIPREKFYELVQQNNDVEGIMLKFLSVDAELLDIATNLKVISNVSVGYDNLNIKEMKKRNIVGTHTPGVLDETVADTTFALMLAAGRRVAELNNYVKKGCWVDGPESRFYGLDIHHTNLGIIGMGRIGEEVAKRAKFGFSMNVYYHNRNRKFDVEQKISVEYKSLEELLKISDFVVLLTPLTPQTEHLMGEREFALMKKNAVFVNVSRGKTVDEKALIKALQNKQFFAAGLDVFEQEPVNPDNPLLKMDNVVVLPHIGSATAKTHNDMAMLAAQNLVAVCNGQEPPNLIPEFQE
jgi:gluconate 2-dehydrogenase